MQEKTQIPTENRLATAPVGRLLVTFSIPCVLSMLVSALYNIVDQIFIGQGVGYRATRPQTSYSPIPWPL